MECLRCGNKDPSYFYKGHKGYYCRRCIRFRRIMLEEEPESFEYEIAQGSDEYQFSYRLTDPQIMASKQCLESLKYSDVLLHCVCGAGKTEIVVESISSYLSRGLKVAYAIARKEVVIELHNRFSKIFPRARVTAVYGGHHDVLEGDLIVCTCHQLYRYYDTFDLLILDEVDAFPLKGNQTLMNISMNACRGRMVFSTATVDEGLEEILKKRVYKKVELFTRPSFRPLPVPKIIYLKGILIYVCLIYLLKKMDGQCIIFVSGKKECRYLHLLFSKLFSCSYVYADLDERNENIKDFRDRKHRFIFATTVLERGITINGINVIIIDTKDIFDESNLIHMLGRIDRGIEDKGGKAWIISDRFSKKISSTMRYIRKANEHL